MSKEETIVQAYQYAAEADACRKALAAALRAANNSIKGGK